MNWYAKSTKSPCSIPAFPCAANKSLGGYPANGMSLLDWFAGQAMALGRIVLHESDAVDYDGTAYYCYKMAEAMMAERARHESNNSAVGAAEGGAA